ncbi:MULTISPECIES: hypothetical protein [Paraburkholderia]|uniref:hypothetical protein n=1 Tax=Paraburkholderia TaxID=1822464 RepID=UPI00039E63BC|nr:hypothetical protein [Paraburkholderia tuberum]
MASLRNESGGCVDDRFVAVIIEDGKDWCNDRFRQGKLLLFESACVNAAFGIESENGKHVSNDANRLSVYELDNHVGHSRSLPRKGGQTVACRISEHPVEPGARQPPDGIVTRNEKPSARKTHGVARVCQL